MAFLSYIGFIFYLFFRTNIHITKSSVDRPNMPALNNWWANQFYFNRSILSLASVIETLSTFDNPSDVRRGVFEPKTQFFVQSLTRDFIIYNMIKRLFRWMWNPISVIVILFNNGAKNYFDKLLTFMSASVSSTRH